MVWYWHIRASLIAQTVTNLPAMQETWVQSLDWEDSQEKEWQPTSVLLPEESHGQRSLAGYSPWGSQKSHTWLSNRHIYKWKRIESPEVIPCIYSQLTFDKGTKTIQWRKNTLSSNRCLDNWTSTCKEWTWTPTHTIYKN